LFSNDKISSRAVVWRPWSSQ